MFNLAATRPDLLTGIDPATGKPAPYGSVGVDINCAVIGFTDKAPTANLADPVTRLAVPAPLGAVKETAGPPSGPPSHPNPNERNSRETLADHHRRPRCSGYPRRRYRPRHVRGEPVGRCRSNGLHRQFVAGPHPRRRQGPHAVPVREGHPWPQRLLRHLRNVLAAAAHARQAVRAAAGPRRRCSARSAGRTARHR